MALAVLFFIGVEIGLVAGDALWQPAAVHSGQCLPGSRGNVCFVAPPQQLAVRARQSPGQATARAIPQVVTLDDEVWLQGEGLPAGEPVSLTLLAPDGTSCAVPSEQIEIDPVTIDGPGAQAFVYPRDCASVEGVWTATFTTSDIEASARFLAIQVPELGMTR